MSFVHSFWWLLFVLPLVPLIIHLINLLRHQRIEWAAMEFLLKSYKKHSQWVWLMQILLLLMRMLAAGLVVAMLAQLITPHLSLLREKVTHHYILLDDSYSMADRTGAGTAMDAAKKVIVQVAARAAEQDSPQRFTLIRFSKAAAAPGATTSTRPGEAAAKKPAAPADPKAPPPPSSEPLADVNAEAVTSRLAGDLEGGKLGPKWEASQLAVDPLAALRAVQQLAGDSEEENRILYVISDFRAKDWESPAELRESLQGLSRRGAEIHLVSCVDPAQPHANLTLAALAPEEGTRAAGVPLFVEFAVKNHGREPARDVKVSLATTYFAPAVKGIDPTAVKGQVEELPPVFLKSIAPGETARGRAQVYFPEAGQHVVHAVLPDDSLAPDNGRYATVDLTPGNPVLIVDGDVKHDNEYYLTSVFATTAGEKVRTGIVPESKTMAELRDATVESLRRYYGIYLLDVPRLDTRAIETLEAYVRGGGCLAFFLGPQTSVDFTNNSLYRKGDGIFPLPIGPHVLLDPTQKSSAVPDFDVVDHAIFSRSLGDRNSSLTRLNIGEYFKQQAGWKPDSNTTKILATLYNHDPLVVEKVVGDGRVIAFLTPLAPTKIPGPPEREWNNLARDPAFVVTLLQLHGYFASSRVAEPERIVGSGIELQMAADKYQTAVKFMVPSLLRPGSRVPIDREATKPREDAAVLEVGLSGLGTAEGGRVETEAAGVYEAWLLRNDATLDPRRYALNVQPEEGDLAMVTAEQLKTKLGNLEFVYNTAGDFEATTGSPLGSNWSEILLLVLILLLLAEQFVAYVASYHVTVAPPAR